MQNGFGGMRQQRFSYRQPGNQSQNPSISTIQNIINSASRNNVNYPGMSSTSSNNRNNGWNNNFNRNNNQNQRNFNQQNNRQVVTIRTNRQNNNFQNNQQNGNQNRREIISFRRDQMLNKSNNRRFQRQQISRLNTRASITPKTEIILNRNSDTKKIVLSSNNKNTNTNNTNNNNNRNMSRNQPSRRTNSKGAFAVGNFQLNRK